MESDVTIHFAQFFIVSVENMWRVGFLTLQCSKSQTVKPNLTKFEIGLHLRVINEYQKNYENIPTGVAATSNHW